MIIYHHIVLSDSSTLSLFQLLRSSSWVSEHPMGIVGYSHGFTMLKTKMARRHFLVANGELKPRTSSPTKPNESG